MTVDPGFPSRIVRWPWAVTPGLQEARVFHWKDAAGAPYDPGTVTAKAGMDGMIAATVTGTGATRTITWSSGQTGLIPGSQWRLNFDGQDWVGGNVGIAQPEDAPPTEDGWTIQLPGDGDGDGLTVTIAAGGGQRFAASVVLHTDSLTPSSGDSVFWVAYTPGHVDAGGPGGSQRVQNDWQVVEAYEWGDESWNPPEGGTDVLLLMGEDSWPSKFATATNGALTVKDVPGLTVVPVGCGGAYGDGEGTALWMARNFEGFNGAPSPVAPAVDFVPVVIGARSVLSDGFTGRLAGLDPNLGAVLDMIDAGLDDHYVALFVADGDYSGGTFTAATLYDTGYPVPRENLVGAPVCVVSGNDMGLWTITASGPCTPGRTIDPGDVIRAYGQGLVALAGSSNGVDVSGINVAATAARVEAVSAGVDGANATIATLTGTVNGVVTEVGTLTDGLLSLHVVGDADAVAGDLRDRATVETPPTAWAVCGEQDATFGDACYFRCTTVLPPPTSTLEVRATARFRSHKADSPFAEIWSEPKDAGGMPGAGGVWDRFELAFWSVFSETVNPEFNRLWLFWEYTESSGTIEEWMSGTVENPGAVLSPAFGSSGGGLPANTWVTVAVFMDMATGTTAVRVRTDTTWDFEHPDDGTRWRTLRTYTTDAGTTSLAASDEVEQWIGRGGGRFDVARVQVWLDGTPALDFDPSTAADEATTVTDSVLLDASDDPAVWEAHDLAVIHNP